MTFYELQAHVDDLSDAERMPEALKAIMAKLGKGNRFTVATLFQMVAVDGDLEHLAKFVCQAITALADILVRGTPEQKRDAALCMVQFAEAGKIAAGCGPNFQKWPHIHGFPGLDPRLAEYWHPREPRRVGTRQEGDGGIFGDSSGGIFGRLADDSDTSDEE